MFQANDPLDGAALFADVRRYASLGVHRFGYEADRRTTDWIAWSLRDAGLLVEEPTFKLGRQYLLNEASVQIGGTTIEALPHWWIPQTHASFALEAPVATDEGDARGRLVWLQLPFDRRAYLVDTHRDAIAAAASRNPAAILLTVDNPADDIFTYNAAQEDPSWPVPVVIVAGKHRVLIEAARRSRAPVGVRVKGSYRFDVEGRNVIGRIGPADARTIVISTPLTGWFTCAGERGPGIATFLALARVVARGALDAAFVFVATTGHEIGHGGMEVFLQEAAPPPAATLAWIHLGASLACYRWEQLDAGWRNTGEVDAEHRLLVHSRSAAALVTRAFDGVPAVPFLAEASAVGELRDVRAAGYRHFFGIAGPHRFFHTPRDLEDTTGPEILEPVARAFARAMRMVAEQGEDAP